MVFECSQSCGNHSHEVYDRPWRKCFAGARCGLCTSQWTPIALTAAGGPSFVTGRRRACIARNVASATRTHRGGTKVTPRGSPILYLILCVCGAPGFSSISAFAQVHPANASFEAGSDQGLHVEQFGTFRQNDPGTSRNFSVFNRAAPTGTTSAMTLVGVQSLGYTTEMPLQTGTISGLTAGGQAPLQLSLFTSAPGDLSVSYILEFASDALPSEPHKFLAVNGFAKILRHGDYDSDGDVDNTDYSLWRSTVGSANASTDGNKNGIVDAADYIMWRNNFTGPIVAGASTAAGLTASHAIPEPSTFAVVAISLALAGPWFRHPRP